MLILLGVGPCFFFSVVVSGGDDERGSWVEQWSGPGIEQGESLSSQSSQSQAGQQSSSGKATETETAHADDVKRFQSHCLFHFCFRLVERVMIPGERP